MRVGIALALLFSAARDRAAGNDRQEPSPVTTPAQDGRAGRTTALVDMRNGNGAADDVPVATLARPTGGNVQSQDTAQPSTGTEPQRSDLVQDIRCSKVTHSERISAEQQSRHAAT